jgi:hypothetical protein
MVVLLPRSQMEDALERGSGFKFVLDWLAEERAWMLEEGAREAKSELEGWRAWRGTRGERALRLRSTVAVDEEMDEKDGYLQDSLHSKSGTEGTPPFFKPAAASQHHPTLFTVRDDAAQHAAGADFTHSEQDRDPDRGLTNHQCTGSDTEDQSSYTPQSRSVDDAPIPSKWDLEALQALARAAGLGRLSN